MNSSVGLMSKMVALLLFVAINGCAPKTYSSLEEALKTPDQVKSLTLGWQKLKVFPQDILRLKNLQRLSLKNNFLSSLPTNINELQQLERLNLANNQFKTLPKDLDKLPKLERLNLVGNPISKAMQAQITQQLPNCAISF